MQMSKGKVSVTHWARALDSGMDVVLKHSTLENSRCFVEAGLLARVSGCPGVVKLVDTISLPDCFVLVTERVGMHCVELRDYIDDNMGEDGNVGLREDVARLLFAQIVAVVQRCAEKSVVHCDLSYKNVVVDTLTSQVALCDFGAAMHSHSGYFLEYHGSAQWAPPEWFVTKRYTADGITAWQLGVLLHNLICGAEPYWYPEEFARGRALEIDSDVVMSSACRELLFSCMAVKEEERLSLAEIARHPWLSGVADA